MMKKNGKIQAKDRRIHHIMESLGEVGEKYITRDQIQFLQMLRRALWGGLVMAFTTVAKFSLQLLQVGTLCKGLLASLNYSFTFLGIHLCHFTLGTKQPSMTASSFASRMNRSVHDIADEIIHMIRSHFGSVLGNMLGVMPVAALLSLASQFFLDHSILTPEKSVHLMRELSVFGPTPLFAYVTGVLLWLSSLIGAWVKHSITFKKCGFLNRHLFAISANVSLGFLLGLTPFIAGKCGLHLDVRHVTLSSGAFVLALMNGFTLLSASDIWFAFFGILSMAFLNLVVSFGFSFWTALRIQSIQGPERRLVYKSVCKKIFKRPLFLFWPDI
jgi:site-specific recombinase